MCHPLVYTKEVLLKTLSWGQSKKLQVCPNSSKSSGLERNTFKHTRQWKISNRNLALSSYETA